MNRVFSDQFRLRMKHRLMALSQRECLFSLILFSLFACLYTYPRIFELSGVGGSDFFQFLWNFWWIRESVENLQSPFFTDYEYYPTGTSLAFHTTSYHWAYLSVPFQYVLPRQVILNLFYILSFIATGMTTFWLLRNYFKHSKSTAFLGSFIFAFCIHRVDRFRFYEIDSLGTMYIPLFMYSFFKLYDHVEQREQRPMFKFGIWAGISLALTTLSSWYTGIFLVIFCIYAFVYKTMQYKKLPLRALFLMVFVFLLIMSPFVIAMLVATSNGDFPPRTYETVIRHSEYNNADLLGYVVPNRHTPGAWLSVLKKIGIHAPLSWVDQITSSYYGNPFEKGVFPSYTIILLFMMSVYVALRTLDRRTRGLLIFLYVTCFSFVVLSFGPTLYVQGEPTTSFMPYRLLMKIPVFNVARAPSRFGIMVIFCLAIVATITLDYFKTFSKTQIANRWLFVVILGLVIAETLPLQGRQLQPIERVTSPFFFQLRSEPDKKLVLLNVPVDFIGARGGSGLYIFHQTIHRQKIIGGYLGREPVYVLQQLQNSPFLRALHHREYEQEKQLSLDGIDDAEIIESIEQLAVDYVILYKELLGKDYTNISTRFRNVLGDNIFEDALIEVYKGCQNTGAKP